MLINKIKLLLVSLFINNLISQSIFFGPRITLNFSSPGCSCMLTSCPPQNKGSCLRYPWSSILSRYISPKRITSHNWEILQPNLVEPSFQQLTLTELMVRKKGSKKGRKTLLELKQLLHDNSSLLKNMQLPQKFSTNLKKLQHSSSIFYYNPGPEPDQLNYGSYGISPTYLQQTFVS